MSNNQKAIELIDEMLKNNEIFSQSHHNELVKLKFLLSQEGGKESKNGKS